MKLGRIYAKPQRIPKKQLHRRISWRTAWQVVGEFATKNMSAGEACQWLEISRPHLYRLKGRWMKMHETRDNPDWLYQRPDTGISRLPPEVQSYLDDKLRYIKEQSEVFKNKFNFSFLAQRCHQRFGKRYHRNTLRRWAIQRGLFVPKVDQTGKPTRRFETGGIGFLYQHDSSPHLWLPKTGRKDSMILTLDDYSRKVVGCRIVPRDTSWNHLCVARDTIETFGCPLAYYTDHHQIFNPDTDINGQFKRALTSLDITLRLAPKKRPQAKGKCENKFGYFQRRVPLLMEEYNVTNLTVANKILRDEVVGYYNEYHVHEETLEIPEKRWTKAWEEGNVFLRNVPDDKNPDIIFGLHYDRDVRNDGSISFGGRRFFIPKATRWGKVTVVLRPPTSAKRPHTEIYVLEKESTLLHHVLPKQSPSP